jgi:MFS family permease
MLISREESQPTLAAGASAARRALALLATAELLAMGLWFSATAILPALTREWNLTGASQAWLTMSVQLGFAIGSLVSVVLNLSDILNPRKLFLLCAVAGAVCTAAIAVFAGGILLTIPMRFLTGMALAGVYPPGMKIMAGWFRTKRGMAVGILVGALTVGSASPHLLNALGGFASWRLVLWIAAVQAALGGLIAFYLVSDGPYQAPIARFDPGAIKRILSDRPVLLANLSYFGHMWELYAFWAWIPAFLTASFTHDGIGNAPYAAGIGAFCAIGIGGLGCWAAGIWADRWGRTTIMIVSLTISGLCCLLAGILFSASPVVVTAVCLVWGFWVVADSAQFSTSVTELADPLYVGTALTLQTGIGFCITLVSIRLIPVLVAKFGWEWAFAPLAAGPALGIYAAVRLRRTSQALRLAGGKR